jgi:mRNA interferase MazF
VLVEQTTAVSPDRLGDSIGRLSASELRNLDAALAVVFGLT